MDNRERVSREYVEALQERVIKFKTMQLPGQPQMMHMGTSYLINDLWRIVRDYADIILANQEKNDG